VRIGLNYYGLGAFRYDSGPGYDVGKYASIMTGEE
jgi:hypothetical protein